MKHVQTFEQYEFEPTNEGKLQRGIAKTAIDVAAFIGKFKSLFNRKDRKELFKNMKEVNKMVDLISFLGDSKKWLEDSKLSRDDIKILADNLGIDKKYPTEWDIFEARYELEFKRNLNDDLDVIIEALSSDYKGKDPTTLTYFKDLKEMAKSLKNLIK